MYRKDGLRNAVFFEAEGMAGGTAGGGAPAGGPGSQAGSGDGGAATPDLVQAAAAAAASQGGQSAGSGGSDPAGASTPYWPEGLPETLNALKGANDRETIDKLAGKIKDAPAAPAKAEDYKLALPEEFTKRYGDLSKDPVVPIWRQIAHKNGMTETQFNGAISELYSELSSKGLIEEPIDPKTELEKLMPKHGAEASRVAQASARINGVAGGVNGLVTRGVLSKTEGNMVLALAATADGVVTLEKLFKSMGEHGLQGGGQPADNMTDHERRMRAMFPSMAKST